ncbi:MAG: DUF4294 domain-containing protein [Bacteroidales bacterium]|nr:DUF4294 domain-containing protein [Bacteroidales bacterium]
MTGIFRTYTFSLLTVLFVALGMSYSSRITAQEIIVLAEHQYPAEIDLMTGDTIAVVQLRDVYCFTKKHFRNKQHEKEFMMMVRDVKKTLPIAKDARRLMTQAYFDMEHMTETEQKVYFKQLEKDLLAQYKARLKRLNYRQGKLLVRLVDRECDKQTYYIIREFLGRRRAFFWNMFGKLFGVSLKAQWDPEGKDRELEDVCIQVEQGLI